MRFPILARGNTCELFEGVIEASDTLKAAFFRDACDRHITLRQHSARLIEAIYIQILIKRHRKQLAEYL